MHIYKKIFLILTPHERYKACLLLFLITITSFLEMLGVASILPFLAILINQEIIETNVILYKLFIFFEFETKNDFVCVFFGMNLYVFHCVSVSS